MDNCIKDRVVAVLKHIGMNVNRASKMLGIPQRTLNRQVNEGGNISMDLVYAILNNVPEISPAWLIAGEGPMLVGEEAPSIDTVPFYEDLPLSAGNRDAFNPAQEKPSAFFSIPT